MPKDYQEVERIVEEFRNLLYPQTAEDKLVKLDDWLRTTLTTYGNVRELEGFKRGHDEWLSKNQCPSCGGKALTQHRAKLREQVIKLPFTDNQNVFDGETVVKRADVLKLLNQN